MYKIIMQKKIPKNTNHWNQTGPLMLLSLFCFFFLYLDLFNYPASDRCTIFPLWSGVFPFLIYVFRYTSYIFTWVLSFFSILSYGLREEGSRGEAVEGRGEKWSTTAACVYRMRFTGLCVSEKFNKILWVHDVLYCLVCLRDAQRSWHSYLFIQDFEMAWF